MSDDVEPPRPAPSNNSPSQERELPFLEARVAALELKIDAASLSSEALHRDLLISEVRQRIRVRYFAVGIALGGILFMAVAMAHAAHHYFWGPMVLIPPVVAIAMFVAPIVSITTITIMLLVGAFRRFKDDDMDNINVGSLAAEAAKSAIGR
ncbi:hypothetical protein G6L05_02860 [Agrobacterium rhizogenes]|nr:hypothetical protein [Rhizobium rhizogenes]